MKNVGFILLSLFFLLSCKKEKKEYTVRYRIYRVSAATVNSTYTVKYTTADGATKTIGNLNSEQWNSGELSGYKAKQYITLSLEGSGGSVYKMYIYTNTSPYKSRDADDNFGAQSLEMKIEE